MARREHGLVLGDVLDALERLGREAPARASLAGLAARANLPHDRLKSYLEELRGHGMVGPEPIPRLTPKGEQFLECYQAWIRIQAMYGIPTAGLASGLMAEARW